MTYPYMIVAPVVILAILMLSFTVLGDGLRDALDQIWQPYGGNSRIFFSTRPVLCYNQYNRVKRPSHSDWGRLFYL